MIIPHVTDPWQKMPDQEKIPHIHYTFLRMDFLHTTDELRYGGEYFGDLTEHYKWAEKNGIEMEHNLLFLGRPVTENLLYENNKVYKIKPGVRKSKNVKIMFVFRTKDEVKKFSKRWKHNAIKINR